MLISTLAALRLLLESSVISARWLGPSCNRRINYGLEDLRLSQYASERAAWSRSAMRGCRRNASGLHHSNGGQRGAAADALYIESEVVGLFL